MSSLIKRGTLTSDGIRPIKYASANGNVGMDELKVQSAGEAESKELQTIEEIKVQAYQEAMACAEEDINAALKKKTDELEKQFNNELNKLKKEYELNLEKLRSITSVIESNGKKYIERLEPLAVAITMHALRRLVGNREIFSDLVKNVIENAVKELKSEEAVTIKLSEHDRELFSTDDGWIDLGTIVFDESLPSGGCIIQSSNTTIDASLPEALDRVASVLADQVGKS